MDTNQSTASGQFFLRRRMRCPLQLYAERCLAKDHDSAE